MPHIENLLYVSDEFVLENILNSLCGLLDNENATIASLMPHINMSRVSQLLIKKNRNISSSALEVANLVCTGPEECVEEFVSGGGIVMLKLILLTESHHDLAKMACLILSNILVGPEKHIQEVINAGVINDLSQIATKDSDFKVRKEATWAIANACLKGSNYQKVRMIKEGVLDIIIPMLGNEDADVLLILIEAIDSLLELDNHVELEPSISDQFESLGGVTKLEELQLHKNETVYKKVIALMNKRYSLEKVDEIVPAPSGKNDTGNITTEEHK